MNDMIPMKSIDMSTKANAKAYLVNEPSKTHTPAEMDAVHRAIRYTKLFKQEESLDKMNEESPLHMPMDSLLRKL